MIIALDLPEEAERILRREVRLEPPQVDLSPSACSLVRLFTSAALYRSLPLSAALDDSSLQPACLDSRVRGRRLVAL